MSKTKLETVLKAAKTIQEYCKSKDSACTGCIFRYRKQDALWGKGCILDDPDHLPETWKLETIKEGL